MMVSLMVRVLFIEISAFHTFAWAEAWMSDTELVAGEGDAARLVELHPGRRDPARRLSAHCALRNA